MFSRRIEAPVYKEVGTPEYWQDILGMAENIFRAEPQDFHLRHPFYPASLQSKRAKHWTNDRFAFILRRGTDPNDEAWELRQEGLLSLARLQQQDNIVLTKEYFFLPQDYKFTVLPELELAAETTREEYMNIQRISSSRGTYSELQNQTRDLEDLRLYLSIAYDGGVNG